MKKTITLLTIILLVVFMVGCENSVNPTVSDTPNMSVAKADGEPISLAKKGDCNTIQSGLITDSDGNVIEVGYDDWGYNYQARLFNGYYCDSYRDAAWCQEWKDVKLSMKWNDAWLSNQDCDGDFALDRHYGFPSYIGSGAWLTNHQSGEYTVWADWDFVALYNGKEYPHYVTALVYNDDGTFNATGGNGTIFWTATGTILKKAFFMRIEYDHNSYWVEFIGTISKDGTIEGTWSNDSQDGTWTSSIGAATIENCNWNYFVKIVAAPADAYTEGGNWVNAEGTVIGPIIWGSFAIIQQVENDPCAGLHGQQFVSPDRAGLGGW